MTTSVSSLFTPDLKAGNKAPPIHVLNLDGVLARCPPLSCNDVPQQFIVNHYDSQRTLDFDFWTRCISAIRLGLLLAPN